MFEGQPQEKVDAMMKADAEFRQLLQRHRELDKQVLDAELGVLPLDDQTLSRMKREKLHAKDKLFRLYEPTQHYSPPPGDGGPPRRAAVTRVFAAKSL
jgi:uncharacterized protein YdcH (DUF465 family)